MLAASKPFSRNHRHRAVEDLAPLGAVVFGGSGRAGEFGLKGHDGVSASAFGYPKQQAQIVCDAMTEQFGQD